jgi:hypothetical protein
VIARRQTLPAQEKSADQGQRINKPLDPSGWHILALDNGRSLRLFRSDRSQQARIDIKAMEGEKPNADAKYSKWLRGRGWTWHSEDIAWSKPLAKTSKTNRYARISSEISAHMDFVELANLIRQDKGLESISQLAELNRAFGT